MKGLARFPWGLAAVLLAAVHATAVPSVNVQMRAAFPAGPYLLELLETAALEDSATYFPLLDRIADGAFAAAATEKQLYDRFLAILAENGHLADPGALSSFKLALSLRTAAPRIEAHYQYYDTSIQHLYGAEKEGCETWVARGETKYCDENLSKGAKFAVGHSSRVLPFDRVLGSGASDDDSAILYADVTSPDFARFHKALASEARGGDRGYRVRYRRSSTPSTPSPLAVSGYGVELALKRTDYIVIDDRESTPSPDTESRQAVLSTDDEFADLKPLSTSELATLGLKTASFILQSDDALDTLVRLTQDLPKFSASIAAHDVDPEFHEEHRRNRMRLGLSGSNALWVNGIVLNERQVEPFSLVEMLRRERNLIAGVQGLGLSGKEAIGLLGHDSIANADSGSDGLRFDWRDDQEEGKAILWLNDIEREQAYQRHSDSYRTLLKRGFPGQLPPLRRNMWNLIIPIDFTKNEDVQIVFQLNMFVTRGLTVRFGFVPLTPTAVSAQQARVVTYLLRNYGVRALSVYLNEFLASGLNAPSADLLRVATSEQSLLPGGTELTLQEILGSEELGQHAEMAQHWIKRLNAATTPSPLFINGVPLPRNGDWMQRMGQKLQEDLVMVQQAIASDALAEEASVVDLLLEGAKPSRNGYIFPQDPKSVNIINVSKLYAEHVDLLGQTLILKAEADAPRNDWVALTVVVDLTTKEGFDILRSAFEFKKSHSGVYLDVLHNPANPEDSVGKCPIETLKSYEGSLVDISMDTFDDLMMASTKPATEAYAERLAAYLQSTSLSTGDNALVMNGRIVGPFDLGDVFSADDFEVLKEFEFGQRTSAVLEALDDLGLGDRFNGPLALAKLSSTVALSTESNPDGVFETASPKRRNDFSVWDSDHSAIKTGDDTTMSVQIVALLNPASEPGQRWAPILKVLSQLDGIHLTIFLNPQERITELPVKRFYRYVLESEPSFDASGNVIAPRAKFKGLPSEALLTAGMDVPPAWLVAAKESVHDLDNVKLSSIRGGGNVEAIYELESILIEGHSRESREAPRGAQLVLGTQREPHVTDTIIMANLGYFQFKASPGMYTIRLKEGRSADIFEIETIGARGWQPTVGGQGTDIVHMTFQGTTLYPRLRRKPGQQQADVLEPEKEDDDMLSHGLRLAKSFFGKSKSVSDDTHADINIFSVASGHLYERMLNIMMVSVMKHTKHTVKFWFIEQFLSPSFKEFIVHLAAEHGFKYEMVTYKWPHWLRGQTEKQREIWGYKILFLDVLFPLSLDKVIFVDADQVVRTDMHDLVTHDLEGAPYGFAPMCDSRVEMEGFRFWKQGYWANYLRGLPYHISALYVVDLRRFRALAAGDRLRQQYHALSADPGSLSNLDQDLPNHMQFSIPIHSLPQDWLWCETWCSDESLATAKTIDLCNNPQTKEPKLDRARRQVPEWTEYDDEIAALGKRVKEAQAQQQGGDIVVEVEEVERNPKSRRLDVVVESESGKEPAKETEHVEL